jgi:hypothetical protein
VGGLKVAGLFRLRGSNRIIPLPTITRDWPASVPLDFDIIRSALWHPAGNITIAAVYLRVDIPRLRRFVIANEAEFADDFIQINERLLDRAKRILSIKLV